MGAEDPALAARDKFALICSKCFAHNGLVPEAMWADASESSIYFLVLRFSPHLMPSSSYFLLALSIFLPCFTVSVPLASVSLHLHFPPHSALHLFSPSLSSPLQRPNVRAPSSSSVPFSILSGRISSFISLSSILSPLSSSRSFPRPPYDSSVAPFVLPCIWSSAFLHHISAPPPLRFMFYHIHHTPLLVPYLYLSVRFRPLFF